MSKDISKLDKSRTDVMLDLFISTFGFIPYIGSAMSAMVTSIIPNQRIERLVKFVITLDERMTKNEQQLLKSRVMDESFVDFVDDVLESAIKSAGDERREQLIKILREGLDSNHEKLIDLRRITRTLRDINDVEFVILKSESFLDSNESSKFYKKHSEVLDSQYIYNTANEEDLDKYYIFQGYISNLISLGLLDREFQVSAKTTITSSDSKFKIKKSQYGITDFGRLIVKYISEDF